MENRDENNLNGSGAPQVLNNLPPRALIVVGSVVGLLLGYLFGLQLLSTFEKFALDLFWEFSRNFSLDEVLGSTTFWKMFLSSVVGAVVGGYLGRIVHHRSQPQPAPVSQQGREDTIRPEQQ